MKRGTRSIRSPRNPARLTPSRNPWRAGVAPARVRSGRTCSWGGSVSRDGPLPRPGATSSDVSRERAAALARQPAAADSSAITTYTPSRDTRPARARADARDLATLRSHYLSLSRPTCVASRASTVHPARLTHLIHAYLICLARPPAAAPPEATRPSRLGWPVQVLPEQSRKWGPARSGGPHFLQSPGGKPRKHPKAGRRPVALKGETHRAKHMEGNTRGETGVSSTSASLPRR
jgi:hypothetical protein